MDKKTAQILIEETFNDSFSEDRFIRFSQELLNDIDFSHGRNWSTLIYDDFADKISKYKRVGLYTDPDGNEIEVLIVEVEKAQMLERARTSLRNFVIKWLQSDKNKSKSRDYGLVAFYAKDDNGNDWRFSFIKLEYRSELDEEKGKVKTKKEFTPAKRYSFLVGKYEKAHTAKNQLLPLLQNISNNPTIEELEAAFSIEKVTDEFFEQYKALFKKIYNYFKDNDTIVNELKSENPQYENVEKEIILTRFTKKLLGQLVFLYFLQKKKWLGVPKNKKWGEGDPKFLQKLFDRSQVESKNYFKDYLQFLFYQALAREPKNPDGYYEELQGKFPFLNGGLFEADYKWHKANISIPDYLFRSGEDNEDKRTGILDVFDRYNFTIKEDEPLDKEVAVDPEMLGKVFENMLDITERKSKGAFYTPREIVHYMCQESLIHYLDNALEGKVKKEVIEEFIRKGHSYLENDINALVKLKKIKAGEQKTTDAELKLPESIRKNADLIDQKLSSIKICDPAIGSGAFPVGLLHELVNAMLVLKPHLSYDYLTEKLKGFGFTHLESISDSRYIYRLKRHIIQESIYGVDIDSSAIDIARLRLWLSLVVDEDDLDPIETLPNLDYKIVCGNSLISRFALDTPINDVFKEFNKKIREKDYNNKAIKDLVGDNEVNLEFYKKITNDFLIESSHEQKLIFREFIKEVKNAFKTTLQKKEINKLSKARGELENLQGLDIFGKPIGTKAHISQAKSKLKELEKERDETINSDIYKNALEWRFEFPNLLDDKGNFIGFDVVIGNPPYVNIYSIPESDKSIYNKVYSTAYKKYDLYVLFFEQGLSLLKTCGGINLITSNKYFSQPYGLKLRELFLRYRILELVNFRFNVFSATVDTSITHIQKDSPSDFIEILDINDKKGFERFIKNIRIPLNLDFIRKLPDNLFRIEVSEKDISIINKLDSFSLTFSDLCYVNYGCRLVSKKGTKKKKDYIFSENTNGRLKPFIEGSDIRKFKIISSRFVDYKPNEHYLSLFPELFESKKLTSKDVVGKDGISVAYDEFGYYNDHTTINAVRWCDLKGVNYSGINREISAEKVNLSAKYSYFELLGYINSEISNYYFNKLYNIDLHFYPGTFQKMILPRINTKELSIVVGYITFLNSILFDELVTNFFTALSNSLIYELYFPEEIKSAGKEILKHLGDLKPITDDMSEEEKLAIIQSEFERLYDPNHPVRFAIETLDSVEKVRIIKEALK
ncbi:MAG: Eco57I restriction-modification methylase domain-containing protein [Bacteroidales bacterium]|nr:Eco57I restriction-modification methylase domain-containing protein [Bacteroidales bacterium]